MVSSLHFCSVFALAEILQPLLVWLTGSFPACLRYVEVHFYSGVSVSSPVPF